MGPLPRMALSLVLLFVTLTTATTFVKLPFERAFRLGEWADPGTVDYALRLDAARHRVAAAETILNRIKAESQFGSDPQRYDQALAAARGELRLRVQELNTVTLEALDLEAWATSPRVPSPIVWGSTKAVPSTFLTPTSSLSSNVVFMTEGQANYTARLRDLVLKLPFLAEVNAVTTLGETVVRLAKRDFTTNYQPFATVLMSSVHQSSRALVLEGRIVGPSDLLRAWNAYYPARLISDPSVNMHAFIAEWQAYQRKRCERRKNFKEHPEQGHDEMRHLTHAYHQHRIHLVVGARTLSVLIGLLHVYNQNPAVADHDADDSEARVEFAQRLDALTGSTQLTQEAARQALLQFSQSLNNTRFALNADFTSIGRPTTLVNLQSAARKHSFQAYDPGLLSVNSPGGGSQSARDQGERQANMEAVIDATVRAFHNTPESNLITVDNFINVFDNFAADESSGYGIMTDAVMLHYSYGDVMRALATEYLGQAAMRIGANDMSMWDDDNA